MAPTRKTESRVEWLERRVTRRSALKTGAAGTAMAATALWVAPAGRTVSAAHTGGHIGTPPPVVCNQVWEDFEGHAAGTRITSLPNITSVYTRRFDGAAWSQTNHPAMIFDTANPTGGDSDLQTPGYHDSNTTGLGKVLIVQERDSNIPDDNAGGGRLVFEFACPVRVDSIQVLDIDNDENGGSVCILQTPTQTEVFAIPVKGDNSVQTIDLGGFGNVTKLTVKFVSSGALAQICYCVPPDCNGPV